MLGKLWLYNKVKPISIIIISTTLLEASGGGTRGIPDNQYEHILFDDKRYFFCGKGFRKSIANILSGISRAGAPPSSSNFETPYHKKKHSVSSNNRCSLYNRFCIAKSGKRTTHVDLSRGGAPPRLFFARNWDNKLPFCVYCIIQIYCFCEIEKTNHQRGFVVGILIC